METFGTCVKSRNVKALDRNAPPPTPPLPCQRIHLRVWSRDNFSKTHSASQDVVFSQSFQKSWLQTKSLQFPGCHHELRWMQTAPKIKISMFSEIFVSAAPFLPWSHDQDEIQNGGEAPISSSSTNFQGRKACCEQPSQITTSVLLYKHMFTGGKWFWLWHLHSVCQIHLRLS